MPMGNGWQAFRRRGVVVRDRVAAIRDRVQRTVFGRVWDRLLEIEFVDRSVALAGKAFVSFFPLVIVVASFTPSRVRDSIFRNMTHTLGVEGDALVTAKEAFASSDDVRKATGILGLVLTIFFATSFTTALQRVYLRAWRRPSGKAASQYVRGAAWFLVILTLMAVLGGLRALLGDGPQFVVFIVVALGAVCAFWWFTAWFMLTGQVRWRVLFPTGVITGVAMEGYAVSATIWMPQVVIKNETQFGFFGVALALVTWFSGAAFCVLVGACAGAVFAADTGPVGVLIRGRDPSLLVDGAVPSSPAPRGEAQIADAFRPTDQDEIGP
jgi:membrane protein